MELKCLPEHKDIHIILRDSKLQRKLNAELPSICKKIDFSKFTGRFIYDRLTIPQKPINRDIKEITPDTIYLPEIAKKLISHTGVCIAGGYLTSLFYNNISHNIDVFFYGLDINEIKSIINRSFKNATTYEFVYYRNVIYVTVENEQETYSYKLNIIQYRNPQEIVQYIGIGPSQIGLTKDGFYITDYAKFCILNRVIIHDRNDYCNAYYDVKIVNYLHHKQYTILFPYLSTTTSKFDIFLLKYENLELNIKHKTLYKLDIDNDFDKHVVCNYLNGIAESFPYLKIEGIDICSRYDWKKYKSVIESSTIYHLNLGLHYILTKEQIKKFTENITKK